MAHWYPSSGERGCNRHPTCGQTVAHWYPSSGERGCNRQQLTCGQTVAHWYPSSGERGCNRQQPTCGQTGPLVSNVAVTDNNLHVDRLWPTGISKLGLRSMAVTDRHLHVVRLWPTGIQRGCNTTTYMWTDCGPLV